MATLELPIAHPIKPMLAKRADKIPPGEGWLFEPKWDGFRALLFRDGDHFELQSRDLKSLNRYFPELASPIMAMLPRRIVLDGEVVIAGANGLEFDTLQQRIHPAASRVNKLAAATPASLVFWDLLALGDEDLTDSPFEQRRARLEQVLADAKSPIHCTPATRDAAVAQQWFERFEGAGLDGVMAKKLNGAYESNKRSMIKVKHKRTCECVLGGFRWHKNGPGMMVGSMLLGLYDDAGVLHHVGVAASFTERRRKELAVEFEQLVAEDGQEHPWARWRESAHQSQTGKRVPGGMSRWSRDKDHSFIALRPERVVEVSYDHMQGNRFRHTTHFVRWRPDKPARECGYAQLEVTPPFELEQIFSA